MYKFDSDLHFKLDLFKIMTGVAREELRLKASALSSLKKVLYSRQPKEEGKFVVSEL